MEPPRWGGGEMKHVLWGVTINVRPKRCHKVHLNTRGKAFKEGRLLKLLKPHQITISLEI
jgi:hypothetical protein